MTNKLKKNNNNNISVSTSHRSSQICKSLWILITCKIRPSCYTYLSFVGFLQRGFGLQAEYSSPR